MRNTHYTALPSAFAAKLNAAVTPMRRERILAKPVMARTAPHLDPEFGVPRHIAEREESDEVVTRVTTSGPGKGAHLKDGVFHVRSWLMRRDCMNAYNILTDEEIRSTLDRHSGYVRGTVRTLAAIYDGVVI